MDDEDENDEDDGEDDVGKEAERHEHESQMPSYGILSRRVQRCNWNKFVPSAPAGFAATT